jgi:peptidoglycan/LPS O-acetylase OafA/YrhL
MNPSWYVGLGAAVLMLIAMYAVKCARERRLAQPRELYWPTLVFVCVVVGGIAGYVYDVTSPRPVELPPALKEQLNLPKS